MKTLSYTLLIFFFIIGSTFAWAGTAVLSWEAPTTNADGTPLTDLAGYRVHYGTSPGPSGYTDFKYIAGNITQYTVDNLTDGKTYYFAVSALDTSGNESDFSNEVPKLIGTTTGGGGGGGSAPSGGGGGGCGMLRNISSRSGPSAGQIALNLLILALPLILVKIKVRLRRVPTGA